MSVKLTTVDTLSKRHEVERWIGSTADFGRAQFVSAATGKLQNYNRAEHYDLTIILTVVKATAKLCAKQFSCDHNGL